MRKSEQAGAKRSGGHAMWIGTWSVAAVVGIGVIAAGAMAATHGDGPAPRGGTAGQQHTAGVTTDGPKDKRSDSVVLQLQDLPGRPDLGDWAAVEATGKGSALACIPAHVTEGLDVKETLERRFVAPDAAGDTGPNHARIGETVLQFADAAAAADALQSVQSWLQDCAAPDMVGHELLASENVKGYGSWEVILRSAQDFCGGTDCDAVWFDREALLRVGDRLVLVSMAEVGGPVEPDGLSGSMRDLVDSAIEAAG